MTVYNRASPKGKAMFTAADAPEYARFAELGVDVAFEGLAMPLAGYHASFGHEIA